MQILNSCFPLTRVKDQVKLTQALVVDPLYLQHTFSEKSIDYRVNKKLKTTKITLHINPVLG